MTHHFFLGGNDLEMEAIRQLLQVVGVPPERVHDKKLGWGASASDYREEIRELPEDAIPVLIELENDLDPPAASMEIIDHHGTRAGNDKLTSLEQVWRLLDMPAEQWGQGQFADFPLIVANDRGYIPAMREMGASDSDIARIRALDRAAQGISDQEERQARESLQNIKRHADGRLLEVHLPHNRIAPVTDHLVLNGGYENLLIVSPGEINFSGTGKLVRQLDDAFPGGWYGGDLPERGFWGKGGEVDAGAVRQTLLETLNSEK